MYISSLCFSHTIPPLNYSMQFIVDKSTTEKGKYSEPKSLPNNSHKILVNEQDIILHYQVIQICLPILDHQVA